MQGRPGRSVLLRGVGRMLFLQVVVLGVIQNGPAVFHLLNLLTQALSLKTKEAKYH